MNLDMIMWDENFRLPSVNVIFTWEAGNIYYDFHTAILLEWKGSENFVLSVCHASHWLMKPHADI